MMSLWDSKGTLRVYGDQKSPYVGTERLRAYWLNSGSFKNRRFSLVPTIEETERCDSLLVALDQRGMADPERARRDGIAAPRRHELRRLRRLHFSVTRCVSAAPHPHRIEGGARAVATSRPERSHPRADFLDQGSRADDTYTLTGTEVPDVVRNEETRSCADRSGENRDVLRVCEIACSFTVVRCRTVDLERSCAEELLEERGGLGKLGGQVPADLRHDGLGEHQTKEAKLPEHQDRVAGARAGQQAGDQDVSIDTDGWWLSLLGWGHPDPSRIAFALGADAPSRQRDAARLAGEG
jgi:hypothetical protein